MNIVSWSDVQNRLVGLTHHKWKADTTKLTGIGEANDPNEGIGEADDPNEGVDEADNLDEGVGKADNLDEGVGEADNPNVALLGLHVCIYKEISCAPRLVLIKKTPTRKGFRKIRSWGFL